MAGEKNQAESPERFCSPADEPPEGAAVNVHREFLGSEPR